jgi:hypothetical protein
MDFTSGSVGVSDQPGIALSFDLQELEIVTHENPDLFPVPVQDSRRIDLLSGEPFLNLIFRSGQESIPVLSLDHLTGRVQGQFPGEKKKGAVLLDGPPTPEDIPQEHSRQQKVPGSQRPSHPQSKRH